MNEPEKGIKVDSTDSEVRQWRVRARGEDVRRFIIENVGTHPKKISGLTAANFGISRQAVNKHLQKLVVEKALLAAGSTRDKSYRLAPLFEWQRVYNITPELAEDQAWSRDVAPVLGKLPQNVMDIWHYCFTEMFNNAIDHSGGSEIIVKVARTAADTQMASWTMASGSSRRFKRH